MDEVEISQLPLNEEVEVSPGFLIERRQFVAASIAVLYSGSLLASSGAQQDELDFETFLALASVVAGQIVDDKSPEGQDRYLKFVGGMAAQVSDVPHPARWRPSSQGASDNTVFIGVNPGGDPFTVLHWRLEPGAIVRPHAHTYGNVATVCLEGTAQVENYEMLGIVDFETDKTFHVQRTRQDVMMPGFLNLVSLHRNYIHGMQAGREGARGLDITTRLRPKPNYGTPYLQTHRKPVDESAAIFEARWQHEA